MVPSNRLHAVPNFAGMSSLLIVRPLKASFPMLIPLRLLFLSNLLIRQGTIGATRGASFAAGGGQGGDFRWIFAEALSQRMMRFRFQTSLQKDRGELRSMCMGLFRRT